MTKHFARACHKGIYLRVIKKGHIQAGNTIQLVEKQPTIITIQDVVDDYTWPKEDQEKVQKILNMLFCPNYSKLHLSSYLTNPTKTPVYSLVVKSEAVLYALLLQ
jgi:MOSC domain-containing protein YiiM